MRTALIAAAAVFAAGVASAEEVVSVDVNASDLNLSQEADAKILYKRIVIAARKACDVKTGYRYYERRSADRECVADAVKGAVKSVNVATLNSVFVANTQADGSFETSAIAGWSDRA